MHELEPFYKWEGIYSASEDERSPFFGQTYQEFDISLYDHVLHPAWDYIGSETLYVKVLFADYEKSLSDCQQ